MWGAISAAEIVLILVIFRKGIEKLYTDTVVRVVAVRKYEIDGHGELTGRRIAIRDRRVTIEEKRRNAEIALVRPPAGNGDMELPPAVEAWASE